MWCPRTPFAAAAAAVLLCAGAHVVRIALSRSCSSSSSCTASTGSTAAGACSSSSSQQADSCCVLVDNPHTPRQQTRRRLGGCVEIVLALLRQVPVYLLLLGAALAPATHRPRLGCWQLRHGFTGNLHKHLHTAQEHTHHLCGLNNVQQACTAASFFRSTAGATNTLRWAYHSVAPLSFSSSLTVSTSELSPTLCPHPPTHRHMPGRS